MENKQDNTILILVGLALFAGFFMARNKGLKDEKKYKNGQAGTPTSDCDSSMGVDDQQAVAQDLLDVCKNTWIWSTSEYQKIYQALLPIPDRCAALGVYKSFGTYEPTLAGFYGSGDLDYWLGDCPEVWRKKFRSCLHGVGSF